MAQSALRNLPKEAQDARRAVIGMSPAVPQDYSGRDLTGELLSAGSLALSPVAGVSDFMGLAADARMYQMKPEERTMSNFAMTLAGLLPLIPSVAATKTAVRSAEAIKEGAKRGIDLAEADRMQRALDLGHSTQDFYHATKADVSEFEPDKLGLTFLGTSPKFANDWLDVIKSRRRDGTYQREIDDIANLENKIDPSGTGYTKFDYFNDKNKLKNEYDLTESNIIPLRTNVQNTFDPSQNDDLLKEYLSSSDYYKDYTDGGLPFFRDGNYRQYETPEMIDFLKSKGFDSMWLREKITADAPYSTLAVFDPANIRSKYAEFDKGQRLSRNISAGVAGTALGLSALRNINKDNQGAE